MIAALALMVAMVVEDSTPLRAAPDDAAPRQAELWAGDWLEVRGEKPGFLLVWDHRRERPGYVRSWRVRTYPDTPESAGELRAIVRFLRDAPGSESLGIGYAALFLKCAAGGEPASDVHDAIGVMADRLARHASATQQTAAGAALAEHRAVAESYGVAFLTSERDGRVRVTYDGEAYRTVLATSTAAAERARAALALTRDSDLATDATPTVLRTWNEWRRDALAQVEASELPPAVAGQLRLRRATVLAWLAHSYATSSDAEGARASASRALHELSQVDRASLAPEDAALLADTTVRVAAVRGAVALGNPAHTGGGSKVEVEVHPGEDQGQSCIAIRAPGTDHRPGKLLAERCTYGVVWPSSILVSPRGNAVAVAVQALASWSELWLFHDTAKGWSVDFVVPAAVTPGAGYVEAAGFSADGAKLALVRDAIVDGSRRRRFQVIRTSDARTEIDAPSLDRFTTFRRCAAPDWQATTLALR